MSNQPLGDADRPCIEILFLTGTIRAKTVKEYEEDRRSARSIGTRNGLAFRGLTWTNDAPPPEDLTSEWQKPGCEEFRISDTAAYQHQMEQLVGLR